MIKPSWRASFLISLLSRRSRLATSRSCTSMAQLVYFILRPCAISSWARAHSKWLLPAPGFPNSSSFSLLSKKLPSNSTSLQHLPRTAQLVKEPEVDCEHKESDSRDSIHDLPVAPVCAYRKDGVEQDRHPAHDPSPHHSSRAVGLHR